MSEIRGAWVPETEAEHRLLLDLHEATRGAYDEGVDPSDIVAAMNYLGAAIALHGDESGFKAAEEQREHDKEMSKRSDCPECGGTIEAVKPFIGGDVRVDPCGCYVTVQQVAGWVDSPGDSK